MKLLLTAIVLLLFAFGCKNKNEKNAFVPINKSLDFRPDCNCLYPDSTIKNMQRRIAAHEPYDSLVAEAMRLIAKDTVLMARDTLRNTKVRVVVTSAVGGFTARLNGIEIMTQELKLPLFPDSLCFWIKAADTQGKLEGNLFINGKKKSFEFKEYDQLTVAKVKFSLKDFKETLPKKPKPDTAPLVQKDTTIVSL